MNFEKCSFEFCQCSPKATNLIFTTILLEVIVYTLKFNEGKDNFFLTITFLKACIIPRAMTHVKNEPFFVQKTFLHSNFVSFMTNWKKLYSSAMLEN